MIVYWIIGIFAFLYFCFLFRDYIRYFFDLIKVTKKNNDGLKEVQNQGIDDRNVKDEKLIEFKNYSIECLKKINHNIPKKKYRIDERIAQSLRISKYSEDNIRILLDDIAKFMCINSTDIKLEVEYRTGKYIYEYAGLYNDKKNEDNKNLIRVVITSDTKIESLISVIAHELTHHLLLSNKIRLDDRISNECLTDVTTVILGFGKYMIEGYGCSNVVLYEKDFLREVKKDRIGYLTSKDIKYLMKKI